MDYFQIISLIIPCALVYYLFYRKHGSPLPLPPSPTAHPVFGHLFSFPSSNQYLAYRDISKQLNSDIISFTVLGQVIIVLNSAEAAEDLLVKRSAIYSDRPELPMLNDDRLLGWGKETGFIRYGERWNQQRKMTQAVLHPSAGEELWPTMVKQARISIQRLLRNPENVAAEFRWLTAANILSSVYGYQPAHPSDDLVHIVDTASRRLGEAAIAGNFYVNTIPWLKFVPSWFPGAGWKRKANAWRAEKDRMINEPFDWTKSQMSAGIASASILKNLLTEMENNPSFEHGVEEEEDRIRWVVGTLYAAGADTIVSSIMTFILAMVLHPEIQQKAQAELDSVLGENRLPELSDRESLPYMNCILKEVSRWNSVAPLGVAHACSQDDEYKGYRIPKGSMVIGNTWAISNNPSVYPEPRKFNPDRFLGSSVPEAPAFGFGRRICPGSHFAESSLFIMASTVLSIFKITPTPGKPIPEAKWKTDVLASHPHPFDCTLTPRSEARRRFMEQWIEF
ncbi:hypothetical protein FS749_015775 [Ceratobasidium sp. UAMH 11750]|nr:hypothetical protein FS749_015775 [Ceratobasidium sp. UAMH 11750]